MSIFLPQYLELLTLNCQVQVIISKNSLHVYHCKCKDIFSILRIFLSEMLKNIIFASCIKKVQAINMLSKQNLNRLYLRDTQFAKLMTKRIYNVLLIANPYDAFMLEPMKKLLSSWHYWNMTL